MNTTKLQQFIVDHGMANRVFATHCGISPDMLESWLDGRHKAGMTNAIKMDEFIQELVPGFDTFSLFRKTK